MCVWVCGSGVCVCEAGVWHLLVESIQLQLDLIPGVFLQLRHSRLGLL